MSLALTEHVAMRTLCTAKDKGGACLPFDVVLKITTAPGPICTKAFKKKRKRKMCPALLVAPQTNQKQRSGALLDWLNWLFQNRRFSGKFTSIGATSRLTSIHSYVKLLRWYDCTQLNKWPLITYTSMYRGVLDKQQHDKQPVCAQEKQCGNTRTNITMH